jgi:bifunctional non-homologous end joining protein LigD
LWLDGHGLTDLPYTERRTRLDELELDAERWRVPEFQIGEGSAMLAATREQKLERVVAKRLDSRDRPGGRAGSWLKIKNSRAKSW